MSNLRDRLGNSVINFQWGAALGSYPGITINKIYGHKNGCPNDEALIWQLGLPVEFPTSADVNSLAIASNSTNDLDAVGASGAKKVKITGLDTNYAPITETVSMNGRNPVPLQGEFLRINNVEVTEAGALTFNAGGIYIGTGTFTTGVPATAYQFIPVSTSVSQTALYTVPASHTALLTFDMFTIEEDQSLTIHLNTRVNTLGVIQKLITLSWIVSQNAEATFPILINEKDDIWFTSQNGGGVDDVGIAFDIVTFENGLLDNTVRSF